MRHLNMSTNTEWCEDLKNVSEKIIQVFPLFPRQRNIDIVERNLETIIQRSAEQMIFLFNLAVDPKNSSAPGFTETSESDKLASG